MGKNDPLRPVCDAIEHVTGKRVHQSTAWRWANEGSFGIQLKTTVLGGRRLCCEQDVHDFMEARTAAATPAMRAPKRSSVAKRNRNAERAVKHLEKEFA